MQISATLAALDLSVIDVVAAIVKGLSLVALLQALGLAMFAAFYGAPLQRTLATLRLATRASCVAGIVLLIANQCLVAARMGGDWPSLMDAGLQSMAWNSSQAVSTALRVIALICIAIGVARDPLVNRSWLAPSIALVAISFPITGHVFAHKQRPLLTPLIVAHILIVTYWLGGVYGLLIATRRETAAITAAIANRFSVHAVIAVPFIAVMGVAMAVVLLPSVASLWQPYGLLLLAKSSGFALLMLLASANKWLLAPAVAREAFHARARFINALRAEYVLLVAVLSITAVMTSWFSPE